jgi:hydroxymethylpyrimidine/phosphomethylpyrimidine kinase
LTIAGSDSGGGAGIQADLKTFAAHGVFGTCAVTVLTAQNTATVARIQVVEPSFVAAQLDTVLADLPVRAVKTGMLGSAETVALVARYAPRLPGLVVDPVLVSSTGHPLFDADTRRAYLEELFPYATVITPNLDEAALLLGQQLSTVDDMVAAARELARTGARCVVVKGGRLSGAGASHRAGAGYSDGDAVDAVCYDGHAEMLRSPWTRTANNHGTGCTFAAATAARLAHGDDVHTALRSAKSYVDKAIADAVGWRLGAGHGPLSWPAAAAP